MFKAPPTRVSLQGSQRLQLSVPSTDSAGSPRKIRRAKDSCNLWECCNEFRLATAFGLIAAGVWNSSPVMPVRFLRSFPNCAG
jgi:hypothetical protein